MNKFSLAAAAALAAVFSAAPASAEGFLASLARDVGLINEQQRQTIDGIHAGLGRPGDHLANQAAGAAVDYFVPGYGRGVTQGLEMRDRMRRQAAGMNYAPAPAPMPYGSYGAPYGYGNPMHFAAPMALPMPYPMY
jgi:hypothetical protein